MASSMDLSGASNSSVRANGPEIQNAINTARVDHTILMSCIPIAECRRKISNFNETVQGEKALIAQAGINPYSYNVFAEANPVSLDLQ